MDQRMKYSYAAVCATGRVRTENQDRIYLNGTICGGGYAQTDGTGRKQGLFAVADGMGGQAQGAQAAQAALEALPPKKCWSPEAVLQAYDAGNRAICDQIGKIGKRSGATLTTLLLADGRGVCRQYRRQPVLSVPGRLPVAAERGPYGGAAPDRARHHRACGGENPSGASPADAAPRNFPGRADHTAAYGPASREAPATASCSAATD